jgi:hypothetical protein
VAQNSRSVGGFGLAWTPEHYKNASGAAATALASNLTDLGFNVSP